MAELAAREVLLSARDAFDESELSYRNFEVALAFPEHGMHSEVNEALNAAVHFLGESMDLRAKQLEIEWPAETTFDCLIEDIAPVLVNYQQFVRISTLDGETDSVFRDYFGNTAIDDRLKGPDWVGTDQEEEIQEFLMDELCQRAIWAETPAEEECTCTDE